MAYTNGTFPAHPPSLYFILLLLLNAPRRKLGCMGRRAFQPPLKASQAAPALPPPQLPQPPSNQTATSILDCVFRQGRQPAQDGSLLLRGRTATLHSLNLAEVASARLDAPTAEALHQAYAAAIAAAAAGGGSSMAVAPAVVVGSVRVEIEDSPAAAVSAEEWAVRQDVQWQVAQQVGLWRLHLPMCCRPQAGGNA